MSFSVSDDKTQRVIALALATVHYGMANLSARSSPATFETVIRTAASFRNYIGDGVVPAARAR